MVTGLMRILLLPGFSLLFLISTTYGQRVISSDELDIRNRIENDIQRNLRGLISTQIANEKFNVATRVKITKQQPPKPENKKNTEKLPAGMDLGVVDVRELLVSYEKQIEELKLRTEQKNKEKETYQVTSIEVVVGLDEKFGEEYKKKFSDWLNKKMVTDYGTIAKTNVTLLKMNEELNPQDPKAKESPENINYKLVLAALVLGLFLFLMGLLIRSGLVKLATMQRNLSLKSEGEWKLAGALSQEDNGNPSEAIDKTGLEAVERIDYRKFELLISKIAFVSMELGAKLNDLVSVWMDSGDEGYIKTALLIDSLLNAREKIMVQTGALAPIKIPLDEALAKMNEESLAEAYRNVSTMEESEKVVLLEKLYWDLVSVKTIGLQSLRRPFDYLQNMSKENVLEILSSQGEDARALAALYLPSEVQSEVLSEFDGRKKVNLIKTMLEQSQISQRMIWDIDTSLKLAVINQSSQPEEKLVNLFPRTIEVLHTLNPFDEISILRQVTKELPNDGIVLKHQYTTLAFIDEWKTEYVKKITQVCTADELVALIRQIPEARDLILNECQPKQKSIIGDDLKLENKLDKTSVGLKLKSISEKWKRIATAENIPMSRVLIAKKPEGARNAA